MSHSALRKEKNCLNCNTEVIDRFCHHCGQENVEPKESVWHMVSHFFNDITHFDGKFFTTVGLLFRRPGLLSREYMAGRRMRFLNPVRMYVFTSALFFLVFFNMANPGDFEGEVFDNTDDSAQAVNSGRMVDSILKEADVDSSTVRPYTNVDQLVRSYRKLNRHQYDSLQASLPANQRDGWIERQFKYRSFHMRERYKGDNNAMWRHILDKFVHSFPYLLFVSLPLFALFLKLLYVRAKRFYYTDHAIFLIHLYIFTFLLLLLFFSCTSLENATGYNIFNWIAFFLLMYGVYYAWKAMRNFYGQSGAKTTLKFIAFNFLSFVTLMILFVVFLIITFFQA